MATNYGMPVSYQQPAPLFRYGEQNLWSTFYVKAGTNLSNNAVRVFCVPRGQIGQGKETAHTLADTNLREGGRVPSGSTYDIRKVRWEVWGVDVDRAAYAASTAILFDFTQTSVDLCMLTHNAESSPGDPLMLRGELAFMQHPVSLPGSATFAMILQTGDSVFPLNAPLKMRVTLEGAYKNVVEIG